MAYPEEGHAKALHRELVRRTKKSDPPTTVTGQGAGVHWRCIATRGDSSCTIHCFDGGGAEYLTSFHYNGNEIANGRTSSKRDTIAAVEDWLAGHGRVNLYVRFAFVDQHKRALTELQDDMLAGVPALAQIAPGELERQWSDIYYLWFRGGERSCQVSYYGKNEVPDAVFHWDETEMFRFPVTDRKRLAAVLQRWLCERALPSSMRREFRWLEIGELADLYERGTAIEGEFLQSWDEIERSYQDYTYAYITGIRRLIADIRKRGHDRALRVGQSMLDMIVSRSRRHGLQEGQPFIAFSFNEKGMTVHVSVEEPFFELRYHGIVFNKEIDDLLCELIKHQID